MLVMFATGIAVLWWMAALTALMVYEKVGRHGTTVVRIAGVGLLGAAALQIAHPAWLPTAVGGSKKFASGVTVGPGPTSAVVRMHGFTVTLETGAQKAARPSTLRLKLSRGARTVHGARVRASYTMLDMAMADVAADVPETGPGTYGGSGPVLGMAGRWGIRLEVAPPGGRSFSVRLVDRVAP
jgi:hypothetical protein